MKAVIWLVMITVVGLSLGCGELTAQTDQDTQTVVKTTQTVVQTTETTEEVIQSETTEPSFGRKIWNGIKAGAVWTWNGIKKGAWYMKEGFISVLEKTGMKRKPDEGEAHDRIIQDANKTLTESRTRREMRQQQFEQQE